MSEPATWVTIHAVLRAVSCLALVLLCWGNVQGALAAARLIDYLYVEANEGDSSGGHAAIRFEKQTFHFQHDSSGIIRIRRLDSTAFDHIYAMLGNRTIQESRIAVSEETYQLLRDAFIQLVVIQDAQLDIRDSLGRDVALFEMLLKQVNGRSNQGEISGLPLKGLGYFLSDGANRPETTPDSSDGDAVSAPLPSPALIKLQERIRSTHGERFIEERITQIRTTLREIDLQAAPSSAPGISKDTYPLLAASASASTSYTDSLLTLFALELLQSAPQLRPGTYWLPESDLFRLADQEKLFLAAVAEQLEGDLVRLVKSSRSDWGFPLIAGMARLAALEASLSSGRLVLLDLFPNDARQQSRQTRAGHDYLPELKNDLEKVFLQRRREFFKNEKIRELDYAVLERVGNQLAELERAITNGTLPRRLPEFPLPSREAWRNDLVFPDMDAASLKRELEIARATEREYAAALYNLYSYDLVRRNCVTEIFTSINSTLGRLASTKKGVGKPAAKDSGQTARDESLQRLGGFVDPSGGLTFIPFVSAGTVDACYSVTARQERLSYRAEKLAEMKKRESPLWVFLRESNTITSTIYRPAAGDSPFLFFTDDTILLRPLFGAFNLLAGVGKSLLGLAVMPLEGTKQLHLGVKGILFSLPELAFVNLRKGSMEYVGEKR